MLEEWSLFNDVQATLDEFDGRIAAGADDPESQPMEEVEREAQDALLECFRAHDCELSQKIEPVDVEEMIKVFLCDSGRRDKVLHRK